MGEITHIQSYATETYMGNPLIYLAVGLCLIAIAGIWGRLFVRKRTLKISEPAFTPPPAAMQVSPHIKHSIVFRVPSSIRNDESKEVLVEYFQGTTWVITEGINSWLYEKLEVIPRALPNIVRGCFTSISGADGKPLDRIATDLSARASSAA